MGPELIRRNIAIGVNVIFEDIFALTTVRHIVSSKSIFVHVNVVISNIQMQMICDITVLFGK